MRIFRTEWRSSSTKSKNSQSEYFHSFFHILPDLHTERTAFFAGTALDALTGVMFEDRVMLADGLRHFALRKAKIKEFGHIGDIDLLRARGAVIAVHAVTGPVHFREGGEGGGVVALFLGRIFKC